MIYIYITGKVHTMINILLVTKKKSIYVGSILLKEWVIFIL